MRSLNAVLLESYPEAGQDSIERELRKAIQKNPCKIVVLDDDPTGIQTVHGVSVYTDWEESSIRQGFQEENKVFYILTNSRGFTRSQTIEAHRTIGRLVEKVSREQECPYMLISRSDSTLRGHYPLETEVLREEIQKLGTSIDGEILCPFFLEGGRYTYHHVHYVKTDSGLIPAGDTEFAKDQTFGYHASDLCEYIEEKTKGAYKKEDVLCIDIQQLREGRVDEIRDQLLAVTGFGKIVVDAMAYSDLEVFCLALYKALEAGKHFLFRTAASIVKVLGGISSKPLLSRNEMAVGGSGHGGIVVVGSHTAKTTKQLDMLRQVPGLEFIQLDSDLVLEGDDRFQKEIERVLKLNNEKIAQGITVVNYTKRQVLVVENDTKEQALVRATKISDAVQSLVGDLQVTPSFVVAKGGITSSDVGTKALGVKKAVVLGQVRPGIPVWKTGPESKFPRIPYVIFPGNVGQPDDLKKVVQLLTEK